GILNMYKIEKKEFGLWLTFGGLIYAEEMEAWYNDFKVALTDFNEDFTVFVDMRTLKPLSKEAQEFMFKGQVAAKEQGMIRSVVILNNPVTTVQFKRIAQETGIYEWERYIDASTNQDWERIGLDWLLKKIDPEMNTVPVR
ncbi:MAG: hypothetical protein ABIJ45_08535, partial [Candidatus Zixiibacteriota bacterium]